MEMGPSMLIPIPMESAYDVVLKHAIFKIAPVLSDDSLHGQVVPNQAQGRTTPNLKGRQLKPKHGCATGLDAAFATRPAGTVSLGRLITCYAVADQGEACYAQCQ